MAPRHQVQAGEPVRRRVARAGIRPRQRHVPGAAGRGQHRAGGRGRGQPEAAAARAVPTLLRKGSHRSEDPHQGTCPSPSLIRS